MDVSDLQDDEIIWIRQLAHALSVKWSRKANSQANLGELCKEAEAAAHKRGILIKMHLTDVLVGGPPTLEVIGKIDVHEAKYGFDHERKRDAVLKSVERGESVHGEKGSANTRKVREK